jgi:hypothetical protein
MNDKSAPVVLFVFNRPKLTSQVYERIRVALSDYDVRNEIIWAQTPLAVSTSLSWFTEPGAVTFAFPGNPSECNYRKFPDLVVLGVVVNPSA